MLSPGFTTAIPLSLSPAITLFLFQIFRKLSSRYILRRTPGAAPSTSQKLGTPTAGNAFLGAACSNAIASALLYPLMLAKTRLQVHRRNGDRADMIGVWKHAIKREGLQGVYQGLDAQMVKGFVSQGVTMVVKQR